MDKLINEWPVVSVNRMHFGLMTASLLKICEGVLRGELSRMDWFTISPENADSIAEGSINFSAKIFLFYSVFAIVDLVMYFRHHPFPLWLLNCVHHVFRIFLIGSAVWSISVTLCLWTTVTQVTYGLSCACLYLKIGLLVDDQKPLRYFRRFAKYMFFSSIISRLIGYVLITYWNFMDAFHMNPYQSSALFALYFLFDSAYLAFHCLPPPAPKSEDTADKKTIPRLSSSSPDGGASSLSVLKDVFDRELFYLAGEGFIAPLRSIGFTPNMVTVLSGAVQLAGLYMLLYGYFKMYVLSCIFAGYVLDCVDGSMARRYHMESDLGAMLDTGKDSAVTFLYLIAVGFMGGWLSLVFPIFMGFLTVARGGLVSNAWPFRLPYQLVMLFPCSLRSYALSCHGGAFTMSLMFTVMMFC